MKKITVACFCDKCSIKVPDVASRLTLLSKNFENKDKYCRSCKGTGYLKSYCDEPDRPCPCCKGSGLAENNY